ncbi:glycoside hydrolase family 3 N-terminal domain-containing protein [Subtercola endophyticus]|uniref:glycoside hydrolase family 3 N-terminal domain-containing protein n=1 Tax=Subtercola endophyticus TaxID=2895559 RepID=UPI001E476146|nr:glycoside hydrolase family 3 N-terminal domain-containing protein [Subtercola endophyticus]UFS59733.1 glycoside hydrolase family 3 protein [Subtercola endophyticus]
MRVRRLRRARPAVAVLAAAVMVCLAGCATAGGSATGSAGATAVAGAADSTPSATDRASGGETGVTETGLGSQAGSATPAPTRYLPTPAELDRTFATTRMRSMSLADKISTMFMVEISGTDPAPMQAYLQADKPGGFLLRADNVPASAEALGAQLSGISLSPGLSPLISIDEEGGDVARLPQDTLPGGELLRSMPVSSTTDAFTKRAALLKQAGVSVNFGTIADVTADPNSFIYDRVLGTDAEAASQRVAASVAAEQGVVFSTLKHFPGHGETEANSHTTIPSTDLPVDQWAVRDAPPFEAGIAAGAELVMFGHLEYTSVDSVPATLSVRWHEMLRGQLGFTGVAVTDDMQMLEDSGQPQYADRTTNAIAAIRAGNDLLLYNNDIDLPPLVAAIAAAVQAGQISVEQIDASVVRILTLQRQAWQRSHA